MQIMIRDTKLEILRKNCNVQQMWKRRVNRGITYQWDRSSCKPICTPSFDIWDRRRCARLAPRRLRILGGIARTPSFQNWPRSGYPRRTVPSWCPGWSTWSHCRSALSDTPRRDRCTATSLCLKELGKNDIDHFWLLLIALLLSILP